LTFNRGPRYGYHALAKSSAGIEPPDNPNWARTAPSGFFVPTVCRNAVYAVVMAGWAGPPSGGPVLPFGPVGSTLSSLPPAIEPVWWWV